MKYKRYVTKDGDYPALIAMREWGNPMFANYITDANPDALARMPFKSGILLDIPVIDDMIATYQGQPPWKGGSDGSTPVEEPDDTGTGTPTGPPPVVALGWFPGFPFQQDNRIHFAVTVTRSEAYQVESLGGVIVENSPAYTFSAGYPVLSQVISAGGLYRVKVGSLTSAYFPVLGTTNPLKFYKIPTAVYAGSQRSIVFSADFAGPYPVAILNEDGDVIFTQNMDLEVGEDITVPVDEDGTYTVAIGPLTGNVSVFVDVDMEINRLSITHDVGSRETTFFVNANKMLDMKLEAIDGTPYTVITEPNLTVKNGDWLVGATQFAGVDYTQYFRYNPVTPSVGGVVPGKQYKLSFREKGTTTPVKEFLYTVPITSHVYPPLDIDMTPIPGGGETGIDCIAGPLVHSMVSWAADMVSWNMDGNGVEGLYLYVKDETSGLTVKTVTVPFVQIVNGVKVPVFSPSYRAIAHFTTPLPEGTYRIGTEGQTCDSPIYWASSTFTIEDDTPVDPGPDPGEQTGDYIVREASIPFPGDMKIVQTAATNGKNLTDSVTTSIQNGYRGWYIINGRPVLTNRLINYLWEFPGPISIRKIVLENWITDPIQTGGSVAGEPVRGIQSFTGNGSYAQWDAVPVKQNV